MTTENNWPPLIPLDRGHDLPEFPVDALPSWLATFVDKEAEATQTPAGLAGSMTLAVLATACAKRVIVQPGDDWREPVNLFITVALEPGNRKTGVARDVVKPLRTAEISFLADLADKIRDRDVERRSLAKAVDAAEKRAGKAEDAAERKALIEEAQEIAKELEGKPPIVAPRFVADDATPETFARLVSEQGGRIAVISGESDLFELLAGRYSDGAPNIGLFLSGHAGDDVRVDRMGRPPIRVDEPAVTIGISTQPHVVSGLASKPGFRGRGLLDRFLFSIPASPLGTRKLKPEPMPRHVRATYESNIADIFAALGLPDDKEPSVLYPDKEADAAFLAFREELEPRLGAAGDLNPISGWASKLPGAVARIAGLLHVARHIGVPPEFISGSTWASAIEIGKYFLKHALAAFDLMGVDQGLVDARAIWAWIERQNLADFTAREARVANRAAVRTAERVDAGLDLLVDHGFVREVPREKKVGRPSRRFEIRLLARNSKMGRNGAQAGGFADSGISGIGVGNSIEGQP